ncbi:cysteine-rich receptor-like protein kinase 19 isoform X2 [Lolium rigidum]|nr:cysteine-rich receptor-like protein kinase 19 isoform X2 [Lolium rigidum]
MIHLRGVQHENIVQLVGYCDDRRNIFAEYEGEIVLAAVEERALCLEYMPGGSLDGHLSDESCGLEWPPRYEIIKGICEGLKYLHTAFKGCIYHLDLKPANILLDKNMRPKIGDFGTSILLGSMQTCITETITGTFGYMPPEYIDYQEISPKFDIFSLGRTMIQVIAGQEGYEKCADMPHQQFIEHVHENWGSRLGAAMSWYTSWQVKACIKIALRCLKYNQVNRPTITEIVNELNGITKTEIVNEQKKIIKIICCLLFVPSDAMFYRVLACEAVPLSRLQFIEHEHENWGSKLGAGMSWHKDMHPNRLRSVQGCF